MRNMKMPPGGGGAGRLAQVLVVGGAAVYGLTHSIFNVEGGHRCVGAGGRGWNAYGRERA